VIVRDDSAGVAYGMRCASAVTRHDGGREDASGNESESATQGYTVIGSPSELFDPQVASRARRVMQQATSDVVSPDRFPQRVALT